MCYPASFVLTKDRVFWSMLTDSHTEIVAEFGLHEDGVRGVNLVKIEISPRDGNLASDPATWVYKLDQDRAPVWYDAAECERRARAALVDWASKRIVTVDLGELTTPGKYWICGSARVDYVGGSARVDYVGDSARVDYVGDSATVTKTGRGATVAKPESPMAVVIDRTGSVAVCSVGGSA